MTTLTFHCDGLPQPQGSAKAFVRGGHAVITSANVHLRPWRAAVTAAAAEARGDAATIAGPVFVTLAFTFPRPAGHYGKRGLRGTAPEFPATRPDLDKLVRACADALTDAGVWRDDAQVVEINASKEYGEHPGVTISVGEAA